MQLSYLRHGPSPAERLRYGHENTVESVESALDAVREDYDAYGAVWFRGIEAQTRPGHLLHEGLEWARDHAEELTPGAWVDVERRLEQAGYMLPRLRHPLFDGLKKHLDDAYDRVTASKEERQSMPKLALHIIEYATRVADGGDPSDGQPASRGDRR